MINKALTLTKEKDLGSNTSVFSYKQGEKDSADIIWLILRLVNQLMINPNYNFIFLDILYLRPMFCLSCPTASKVTGSKISET